MTGRDAGRGPGPITRDGCAVELYARLAPAGEPEIIHAALAPGADILDLGAGTGRIARPLTALGHPVVAVDESPEMLSYVDGAEAVCSPIERLRLARRFDAVLLASHLVNTPDPAQRAELLATARQHVTGLVLIQWHPPAWFDQFGGGGRREGRLGSVTIGLRPLSYDGEILDAVAEYATAGSRWEQRFRCLRLTVADLETALHEADLRFTAWLSPDRSWLSARPVGADVVRS